MPDKNDELGVKKLTGGYVVVERVAPTSVHGKGDEHIFAAENRLTVAKYCLHWLDFNLPDIDNALIILEGNRG